jgi:hypothetical protein
MCLGPAENRCGGCIIAMYCSPECQKKHWKKHKMECQVPLVCMGLDGNPVRLSKEQSEALRKTGSIPGIPTLKIPRELVERVHAGDRSSPLTRTITEIMDFIEKNGGSIVGYSVGMKKNDENNK